jgi:hypothetical protein
VHTDAAISQCLPSTFKAKCPTGNVNAAMAAELNEAALKCKACSWSSNVVDLDPRARDFAFEVTFGDLMDNNGNYVQGITQYELWYGGVPSGDRPDSDLGIVIPRSAGVSCCDPKKYSFTFSSAIMGQLPTNYAGTMKVWLIPKTANGALPPVAVTGAIPDKTVGQAKLYTSQVDVTMPAADITTLMSKAEASMKIAKAISNTVGLSDSEGLTIIKKISHGNPPTNQVFPATRRLMDSKLRVEFQVLVTAAGKTLSNTALTSTAGQNSLMMNIEAQAAIIGASVDAKGVAAQALTPTTVGVASTGTTSAAFGRMVSLLGVITAIGAQMMRLM